MVLSTRRLEAADLLDRATPVRAMRADDERRLAGAEEPALERPLKHQLLLGRATSNPALPVAIHRRRLDPGHARIAEVAKDVVQVVRVGAVVDVELDEVVVLPAVRVEPGVD